MRQNRVSVILVTENRKLMSFTSDFKHDCTGIYNRKGQVPIEKPIGEVIFILLVIFDVAGNRECRSCCDPLFYWKCSLFYHMGSATLDQELLDRVKVPGCRNW